MFSSQVLTALLLASFAGLATTFGALIAFFSRLENLKFLAISLGFSAGVMIYISFMEILPQSFEVFETLGLGFWGEMAALLSFFTGVGLSVLTDKLVPQDLNMQDTQEYETLKFCPLDRKEHEQNLQNSANLKRAGVLTAIAIAIHNFPEGFATFTSALNNVGFGIVIAIAIAIHNIPEGMAVSLPIYHATGDKKRAFIYSCLSGLTEPLGAIVAATVLLPFLNEVVLGAVFGVVAGIMVYISFDELLPAARVYGEAHHCLYGLLFGMALMGVSLAGLGSVF